MIYNINEIENKAFGDTFLAQDGINETKYASCQTASVDASADHLMASSSDDFCDTYSVEVHLGAIESRYSSEVSSLSYQDLLDDADATSSSIISIQGSEDITDSYSGSNNHDLLHDGVESFAASDLPLCDHYDACRRGMFSDSHVANENAGCCKKSLSFSNVDGENNKIGKCIDYEHSSLSVFQEALQDLSVVDEHVLGHTLSEPQESVQEKGIVKTFNQVTELQKQNSLQIRNNIPSVGSAKISTVANIFLHQSHLMMQSLNSLKQAPGSAHRVCGKGGRCDVGNFRSTKNHNFVAGSTLCSDKNAMQEDITGQLQKISAFEKGDDVENEYDCVGCAVMHHGNSYIGMRLACTSSSEEIKPQASCNDLADHSLEFSKRFPQQTYSCYMNSQVNEDACKGDLTDAHLGTNLSQHLACQAFTLSPEATECDSVDVESVNSDMDNVYQKFPTVEDGLSSSQESDDESYVGVDSNSQRHRLCIKRKASANEIVTTAKGSEFDTHTIMDDLKAKREALDIAIADINSAIQHSKQVSMESPYAFHMDSVEPVWIPRVNQQLGEKSHHQDMLLTAHNAVQPDEHHPQTVFDDNVKDDCMSACSIGHNNDQMDTDANEILETNFLLGDGKLQGCYSDGDGDTSHDILYTRRNRGKRYAALSKEDSLDHGEVLELHDSDEIGLHVHDSLCARILPESAVGNHRHSYVSQHGCEGVISHNNASDDGSFLYVHQDYSEDSDTDEETDRLLQEQYRPLNSRHLMNELVDGDDKELQQRKTPHRQSKAKEVALRNPDCPEVLIEGVLFRARYLGSTQLLSEGQPSKAMRMMQAQEAVGRIKAPEGENQPSTDVDLFVSTEKIMVLNTDLQEIMMDHALRTISYIADIGDILVIMARRRILASPGDVMLRQRRQAKILCHVFECDEAQLVAQSIGQAFQVAYLEFLKANGIEDPGLLQEMDYQDVLNQQEIYGEELQLFSNKDYHKEVIMPKGKSEPIGVVIVESGWGSMVPTVVLANMLPSGPAARCGQLNIGDQIISVNGVSLVGLPLSACQTYIKAVKMQSVVKLTVVPCPPVVEVLIKRPDIKYHLGFSVQNGVICSLLRGGIAERGGVRVGHRIIDINSQSVVAVPHEKIVSMLATSVGEGGQFAAVISEPKVMCMLHRCLLDSERTRMLRIHMKTMPTSIFRLLTGQDVPHYL